MRENYITAVTYCRDGGRSKSVFPRISELFVREPNADNGPGSHYIVNLIGNGTTGALLVSIVCENHEIPVLDLRNHGVAPIRDIVQSILENSPSRCAILLDVRDNELMQKVRSRIAAKTCDLRYRRVVFCLADQETSVGTCIQVPGSTDDKMTMLLYHVPGHLLKQAESSYACFLPLAESMVDYALFHPKVWREVVQTGTLSEFLSTAMYQVIRRVNVSNDSSLSRGAYPSFEVDWRRSLAVRLRKQLVTPPDALCPHIHRVIPIGVSSSDAMQAMTVAIPKDIQDPYAITVQSSAIDDQCGSIAITQPMNYTVINVNCLINPGILVDVCRELRTGYRAVVNEVHSMNKQLSNMKDRHDETTVQLSTMRVETSTQLSLIQDKMAALVTRLEEKDTDRCNTTHEDVPAKCTKDGCPNLVTKRFRSGKRRKQCVDCVTYVINAKRRTRK